MTYTVAIRAYRNIDSWVETVTLPSVQVQAASTQQAQHRALMSIPMLDGETLRAVATLDHRP